MTRNPAAVASKDPRFEHFFNVDFAAALHFLPPWSSGSWDWDNDGNPDQPIPQSDWIPRFTVVYLTASAQVGNFGFGAGADLQNFLSKTPTAGFNLGLAHLFAAFGYSAWSDQILIGLGAESTHAVLGFFENRRLEDSVAYNGWGIQGGLLWRPKERNYRIGFAYRPAAVGGPSSPLPEGQTVGGLTPFQSISAPARISLGASWAWGTSGRNYNITGPEGWTRAGLRPDGTDNYTAAMTRWLFTTQLDAYMPVRNALSATQFLEQKSGVAPAAAGDQISFSPRIGIEKEVVRDLLRLRAGGYLEPAQVQTGRARPHGTAGAELYLFKLGPNRTSVGLSGDLARAYFNLSVAFLVWK